MATFYEQRTITPERILRYIICYKLGNIFRYLTLWTSLIQFLSILLDLETLHHRNCDLFINKGQLLMMA